jgi:hypothetical protein
MDQVFEAPARPVNTPNINRAVDKEIRRLFLVAIPKTAPDGWKERNCGYILPDGRFARVNIT